MKSGSQKQWTGALSLETLHYNYFCHPTLNVQFNFPTLEVDGDWSEWCTFTPCSVTCGGGVRYRNRTCTNPPPQSGGQDCLGPSSELQKCNTESCREYRISWDFLQSNHVVLVYDNSNTSLSSCIIVLHLQEQITKMPLTCSRLWYPR